MTLAATVTQLLDLANEARQPPARSTMASRAAAIVRVFVELAKGSTGAVPA